MEQRKFYDALSEPELIEYCTNCTHEECNGECMDYKRMVYQLRYGGDTNTWKRMKYTYKGRSLTAQEWAREYGLSVERVRSMLRKGVPIAEVIESGVCERRSITFYEYNGERKTISGWARYVGLSDQSLRNRLARGMSIEEALTLPRSVAGRKSAEREDEYGE